MNHQSGLPGWASTVARDRQIRAEAQGEGQSGGRKGMLTCQGFCLVPEPLPCPKCHPSLSLQRPSLEDLLLGSDASLTCTLRGLKKPEGATFTWQPSGGKDAIQKHPEPDSCGCFSVSSVLPGCAEPWNSGETFTCTVSHPELEEPKTATIAKATGGPSPTHGVLKALCSLHVCLLPTVPALSYSHPHFTEGN
jgi:hypothetical protein